MTEDLVEDLSRLPATPGITYRGMSGQAPDSAITLSTVLPTSANPRFASENFTAPRLAAIVTFTGRLIAPLSQHPEEEEITLLPGTVLLPVGSVAVSGLVNDVLLLAEMGDTAGVPSDSAQLRQVVIQQVTDALAKPQVTIYSPGRFTPHVTRNSG